MPLSERLRLALACEECRFYRRWALTLAFLFVVAWMVL